MHHACQVLQRPHRLPVEVVHAQVLAVAEAGRLLPTQQLAEDHHLGASPGIRDQGAAHAFVRVSGRHDWHLPYRQEAATADLQSSGLCKTTYQP